MTALLVSHFLIDLQEANRASTGHQTSLSGVDSLDFTRNSGLGSLGLSIPAPWEGHVNDDNSNEEEYEVESA